jgi:hypothetical protein
LESLATKIRQQGFEREAEGRKVPDWATLFGDGDLGDIIGTVYQKTMGYVAPGSHAGRSSSREEAEFALMVAHAIASLTVKRESKIS